MLVSEVIDAAAKASSLSTRELIGPTRSSYLLPPRRRAMFLAYRLTPASYPTIGRSMGGRDHTTILHAVRRVEEMLARGDNQEIDGLHQILQLLGVPFMPGPGKKERLDAALQREELRSRIETLETVTAGLRARLSAMEPTAP